MKYVLILYPIDSYIDFLINPFFGGKEEKLIYYKKIIKSRYPDFKVVCVLFSKQNNANDPDFSQLSGLFKAEKDYSFGACGISFKNHCKNKTYPKPKDIINLCSEPIDELIVGGFHIWDCVNKVARFAYKQGIKVVVDEDLTQFFFLEENSNEIPISREVSAERRKKRLKEGSRCLFEYARKKREKTPWVAHF
jgi:hypothetical protein